MFQAARPGRCLHPVQILLQAQALPLHQQGMRRPHIPIVPRLTGDTGQGLLFPVVPLDEAIPGRQSPEPPAGAFLRKIGPDEVDLPRCPAQVDGKPRLVLAAPGDRHILPGERLSPSLQGVLPNGLLLRLTAPAGDRHDLPRPACCLDAGGQQPGGLPLQQDIGIPLVRCCQQLPRLLRQGMLTVHQHQRPGAHLPPAVPRRPHSSAPSWIRRLTSSRKGMPAARIMAG